MSELEVGDMPGVTSCLARAAALAIRLDMPIMAARLYGAVENQRETLDVNAFYTDQAEFVRIGNTLRGSLDAEIFATALSTGWAMSLGQAIELAEQVFGGEI